MILARSQPVTYPFLIQFSIPELTCTLLLLPHPPRPDWQVTDWVPPSETLCDMLLPQCAQTTVMTICPMVAV